MSPSYNSPKILITFYADGDGAYDLHEAGVSHGDAVTLLNTRRLAAVQHLYTINKNINIKSVLRAGYLLLL